MGGRPVGRLKLGVLGNPALGGVGAVAAGLPVHCYRRIHLQHRRGGGIDSALEGHHVAPDAVGQGLAGRQAGKEPVEVFLKPQHGRAHIFIDVMGRFPEPAGGQHNKGNQQDEEGHYYAVGHRQNPQVAVGLVTEAAPFPQAADGLDAGHQQQGGQQVDAHIDAAFLRQESQVGEQTRATEDKDAPEVAVAGKDPGSQIAGQPSKAH